MFNNFKPLKNKNLGSSKGFTVVELTIATAVFSVVLLTALAGFLQIGRIFYKGVTVTSTQETANQIYQDISGYFQTASAVSDRGNGNGYNYYCVGGARFTFTIDKAVDSSATPNHSASGNFGILKDILPGNSACDAPCNDLMAGSCTGTPFQNPKELLGDKMRVLKFAITNPSASTSNFYNISISLAYGDNEVMGYGTAGDPTTRYCLSGSRNQQFCSIANIDSGVFKGFQ
jgi:prepilin-type N-terminal cleavage/methylation domain-containing protein